MRGHNTLVFDTKEEAQAACNKIYCNMVDERGAVDGTVYTNPPSTDKANIADLTDEQKLNVPLLSYRVGQLNKVDGFMVGYATPRKRATDGKWYIPKPEDSLMTGVSGTPATYADSWKPAQTLGA